MQALKSDILITISVPIARLRGKWSVFLIPVRAYGRQSTFPLIRAAGCRRGMQRVPTDIRDRAPADSYSRAVSSLSSRCWPAPGAGVQAPVSGLVNTSVMTEPIKWRKTNTSNCDAAAEDMNSNGKGDKLRCLSRPLCLALQLFGCEKFFLLLFCYEITHASVANVTKRILFTHDNNDITDSLSHCCW